MIINYHIYHHHYYYYYYYYHYSYSYNIERDQNITFSPCLVLQYCLVSPTYWVTCSYVLIAGDMLATCNNTSLWPNLSILQLWAFCVRKKTRKKQKNMHLMETSLSFFTSISVFLDMFTNLYLCMVCEGHCVCVYVYIRYPSCVRI